MNSKYLCIYLRRSIFYGFAMNYFFSSKRVLVYFVRLNDWQGILWIQQSEADELFSLIYRFL